MCAEYKRLLNIASSNKANKEKNNTYDDESGSRFDLVDIWRVNPAYRDINLRYSRIRGVFVVLMSTLLFLLSYLVISNLYLASGFTLLLIIGFGFEQLVGVYRNISGAFREVVQVNPFENFRICKLEKDPTSLIIINKRTATNLIVRVFQIDVLPENVHPTLNQFLKALNSSKLEYSYQIVQKPMVNLTKSDIHDEKSLELDSYQTINSSASFQTSIFFSVFFRINGILGETKKYELLEVINKYSNNLKSNFSDNFHHTRIRLLSGIQLINAIRILTFNQSVDISDVKEEHLTTNGYLTRFLAKMLILLVALGYIWFVLLSLKIHPLITVIIESVVILSCFFVWWRDILFVFTNIYLKRASHISAINPFEDVKFYQLKSHRDILFASLSNKMLTAVKIMNLKTAIQPMLAYLDKFFRALNNHQIPYAYSLYASPISPQIFSKECFKSLNESTIEALDGIAYIKFDESTHKVKYPEVEYDNWLQMRSGVWKTILTITAISYKYINRFSIHDFLDLGAELSTNSTVIKDAFEDNFLKLFLTDLKKELVVTGFVGSSFKNMQFNPRGSRLNYVYFQGKNLMELAKISGELKKGLDTKIAAEFNTPTHLTNHAIIGKTINTEFLEEEKPLGFTLEQYKRLLITNGSAREREAANMKIALELIKTEIPCIIFDYSGEWSRLIRFFENTMYEDKFLLFNLGKTFTVSLSKSGLKYDKNSTDYLSLFFDAFALAYKEQKISIEALKKSLIKEQTVDLDPILLDFKYDANFKSYSKENRMLNILNELTNQTIVFSKEASEFEDPVNPIDFLKNDKSIIIDLSILKDLENKTFLAFVILSKFIHYVNNRSDYREKAVFIPNIDAFFDANFLDSNYNNIVNFGKIDKFLEPLCNSGFGLIFSANQIRYLHQNFLNYFPNLISFKATDPRDIAVLKNQMNLQELQGSGYYSSKRNNTYQIDYLKNLRGNEVIVKRADIYQPFPGIITYERLSETRPLTHDKIIEYMEHQGYNLKRSERRILDRAKKTLFEKDFGSHSYFLDDIINFLGDIKSVDKIGQLYKGRLKEELLKYITPSAKKRKYEKKIIKELRDEILDALIKHDYLVESHPKRASGSESMRTSYQVGSKYQIAVDDYFQSKKTSTAEIVPEVIDLESFDNSKTVKNTDNKVQDPTLDNNLIKKMIEAQRVNFIYEIFLMSKFLRENQFKNTQIHGRKLIINCLSTIYRNYLANNRALNDKINDLSSFVEYLVNQGVVLFTIKEIEKYLEMSEKLSLIKSNSEKAASDLIELIQKFELQLFYYV